MTGLMRYDPFREIATMRRAVDNLLDWAWNWPPDTLAVDMIETDKAIIIEASLPGFDEKDIDVNVRGNTLTISAKRQTQTERRDAHWHIRECHAGAYYRELTIPEEIKARQVKAELKNGLLTITLPKAKPGPIEGIKVAVQKILPKVQRLQIGGKK